MSNNISALVSYYGSDCQKSNVRTKPVTKITIHHLAMVGDCDTIQQVIQSTAVSWNYGIGNNGEITEVSFGLYANETFTAADGATIPCYALIEIAKAVPEEERAPYIKAALNVLHSLEENYCDWTDEEQSILQHGVESYTEERLKGKPIIYGDYYFTEAIYKLKGFEPLFW